MDTPYYHLVPKDFQKNLQFRKSLYQMVDNESDRSLAVEKAAELRNMCANDILFYFNAFCWTYDPRRNPAALPFITYEYQDAAILKLADAIHTGYDLGIEKSRDMGASWLCIMVPEWFWHFFPLQSFLFVSRKEEYVYKSGDLKALFQKIEFVHKRQPNWMFKKKPKMQSLHLENRDNGSTIDGESTTGDVARGDRRTAVLLDEFASVPSDEGYAALSATRDVTRCRLFNSTPKGASGAFFDMITSPDLEKLRMHWTEHPDKSKGLYVDDFGKERSPWYDEQCKRAAHPAEIAQELDIDYAAADSLFFDAMVLEELIREMSLPPSICGELDYERDTLEPKDFELKRKGHLRLWCPLDQTGRPPMDRRYVVAADIATGTGASNSALSIGDTKTNEKIGEFAFSRIKPSEFADLAVAVAKFFGEAWLIWEANGPGRTFGDRIIHSGYRRIYYKTSEESLSRKRSDIPGWYSTRNSKEVLLTNYRRALQARQFLNRSKEAIAECKAYVYTSTGAIAHTKSVTAVDPSGARDNHGDRVIADALCWKMMSEAPLHRDEEAREAPASSFAYRRKLRQDEARQQEYW